jgi:hypothetical protein
VTKTTYSISVNGTADAAYIKSSNTAGDEVFGYNIALSSDGNTLAVGEFGDASDATGINGNETDTSASESGAVLVFTRTGTTWSQQSYIKASNASAQSLFGYSVALSGDGNTLVVGAVGESSDATGINGNQADTSASGSGAVYVFTRAGTTWSQQTYIKASNTSANMQFGWTVAISSDGSTLGVGAPYESSDATGINGNESNSLDPNAGAVYVFTSSGTTWSQQAYVKASNTARSELFGLSVALSSDGATLAVGATGDSSDATGINGNQSDTSASYAGAAYVFSRTGTTWSQQAYVKASNTSSSVNFGGSVALSGDGNTLAVGAAGESSNARGIDGNQSDTSAGYSGAAYLFGRTNTTWSQEAYIKASNAKGSARFGTYVTLSTDGSTLAVGAPEEWSDATGVDGNQSDISAPGAGAVYVFTGAASAGAAGLVQGAYVKSFNTLESMQFGLGVALSGDGTVLAVGAPFESSDATGINGNESNTLDPNAGAVYVYQ